MKTTRTTKVFAPFMCALIVSLTAVSCSSGSSASDAVANVNEACKRVRAANEQLAALNLDEKGAEALKDPRVNEVLKESAAATKDLAERVDAAAKNDEGRIGNIRNAVERNKSMIKKIGTYVAAESIDDARDKARQMRALADIVGADACAGK